MPSSPEPTSTTVEDTGSPVEEVHASELEDLAEGHESPNQGSDVASNDDNESLNGSIANEEEQDDQENSKQFIDEEVYTMKAHRRAAAGSPRDSEGPKKKEKRKSVGFSSGKSRTLEDGTIVSEDEDGNVVDIDDEEDLDPEVRQRRELESKFDAALENPKKRRKMDGDDIEQMQDDRISELREQMRQAAIADAESVKNGQPAVSKLNMLPEVRAVLQKYNLADSILDNNLLEAVRMWLEPLPDASLPAFEIQRELFEAIDKLPIKTIHLRESGLGKVVLFYQKSKRPQPRIKRIADKLVGNWTRPIMGRSDNYRDKMIITKEYNPEEEFKRASLVADAKDEEMTLADEAAIRRNRARIPTVKPQSFEYAPVNRIAEANANRKREAQQDSQYKRLRQKLTSNRGSGGSSGRSAKKSGVSIEGKELRT